MTPLIWQINGSIDVSTYRNLYQAGTSLPFSSDHGFLLSRLRRHQSSEVSAAQILKSIRYHPLVVYAVAVILAEFATYGLSRLLHKPEIHLKRYQEFVYLGVAVILVNWVLKNILLLYGIDLLTERI